MKKIFFLILGMILSVSAVMNEAAAQDRGAPKIRIGEFTGSSDAKTAETESDSSKGLTNSDVEFLYKAGFFDEDPFLRHRISVAYNSFYIDNKEHFIYEGGAYKEISSNKKSYSHGIAIQYHLGASFLRDYDWLGNPLLGVNLFFDGSFGSVGWLGNIMTLGVGGEIHFLWICKIAVGIAYIQSEKKLFTSGEYYYSS